MLHLKGMKHRRTGPEIPGAAPLNTKSDGKSSPTALTFKYYPFGQCPPSSEGFGGPWMASEGFRKPQRASKDLRGPKGVLGASEGLAGPQ